MKFCNKFFEIYFFNKIQQITKNYSYKIIVFKKTKTFARIRTIFFCRNTLSLRNIRCS